MGCGSSNDKPPPRRPRPNDGEGRGRSRDHPDRPGISHVVRQKDKARAQPTEESRPEKNDPHTRIDKNGIPIFKIPKQRKEKLIPNLAVFSDRDKWAEKAPADACKSVRNLAEYLAHEAKSDLEAVRAIYRWMAVNICYDAESYLRKTHRFPSDPEAVLQFRITVCDGYSKLFEALCKSVDIPCKYVAGFSKGTSYDPDIPITVNSFVNHAWNIVCVKGEWWPVDVTWGAGFMEKNKFVWHYNELNFLTDPDIFILSHFPYMKDSLEYSEPHQLLKKPISLELFNQLVKPDRNGLEWGLELLTHTFCTIDVRGEVEIKFLTKKVTMTNVSCNFNRRRTGENYENHVLIYQKDGVFVVKVKPPTEGTYKLMLFGETEGMTKQQGLVNYIIHCVEPEEYPEAYPEHFGMWGPQPNASACGFDDGIQDLNVFTSTDGNLKISIPLKERVDTIVKLEHSRKSTDLEDFVSDASNDKVMVIIARLPYKGYYKMQIYANDPEEGGNSYVPAAFFFITCRKGLSPVSRFSGSSEAQQFLQKEASKSRKKKPKIKRPPTPPPPESEEDEEDEEEDEEDENGKKKTKEKNKKTYADEKSRPNAGNERDTGRSNPRPNTNDKRNKSEDADNDEYVHEPTVKPRSSNSKDTPAREEAPKVQSNDQDSKNSGNRENGQQELKYDQQGNGYDQFGNLVQPAVKFNDISPAVYNSIVNKNKEQSRTTSDIHKNHSKVHHPNRGTKASEKNQASSTKRNLQNSEDGDEYDEDDNENDDEDDEEDDDDKRQSSRQEDIQIERHYPSQLSTVRYVDPYSGRVADQYSGHGSRQVVPAVEEQSDDEEEEEEGGEHEKEEEESDEDETDTEEHHKREHSREHGSQRYVREPSSDRYEDENERNAREIKNQSHYWSTKSPEEPEISNNVTVNNNELRTPEPRNLYVPYRGVRRMPPPRPSQPKQVRQEPDEEEEEDEGEDEDEDEEDEDEDEDDDDDNDEDESQQNRRGRRHQLDLPHKHYDEWNQALGSSSPNSYSGAYGQTGYHYSQGRYSSPQDFSTPYPTQNSYRHLSTVHRP